MAKKNPNLSRKDKKITPRQRWQNVPERLRKEFEQTAKEGGYEIVGLSASGKLIIK